MFETENVCLRCREARLKSWDELTSDEKFVAERLPASAEFSAAERRQHSFCTRCWYESKYQARTV